MASSKYTSLVTTYSFEKERKKAAEWCQVPNLVPVTQDFLWPLWTENGKFLFWIINDFLSICVLNSFLWCLVIEGWKLTAEAHQTARNRLWPTVVSFVLGLVPCITNLFYKKAGPGLKVRKVFDWSEGWWFKPLQSAWLSASYLDHWCVGCIYELYPLQMSRWHLRW